MVLPRQLEPSPASIARAIAVQCYEGHAPICVSVWYSDASCSQVGVSCHPAEVAGPEPDIVEAIRAALARSREDDCRPVCLTVWFSDNTCTQWGLPPAGRPAGAGRDELTHCKQDITGVLQAVNRRLTTSGILGELTARQIYWGESTVKRALAEMVRDGQLTNRGDVRPRGYGLPAWH
jgi:hypothetical protein